MTELPQGSTVGILGAEMGLIQVTRQQILNLMDACFQVIPKL